MDDSIRVLHVDDDPEFGDLTGTLLEREDDRLSVETATGAREGLEALEGGNFDCVVSDYDMPGMNGLELLDAVREEAPGLPFVLFTGKGSEELASDAIAAGVSDYLQKRGGTEQYAILANRVVNAVSKRRAQTNYRELFEKADVGITLHDPESGYITDANQAIADLLEADRGELIGAHPGDFEPEDSEFGREQATRQIRRAAEDGSRRIEWLGRTATGEEVWVEITLNPTTIDGRRRVLAVTQEITERKRRERKLEQLREYTRELTYTRTTAETTQLAAGAVDDLIGASLSGVVLLDEDETALETKAVADSVREVFDDLRRFERDAPDGSRAALVWEAFRRDTPIYIDELSTSDRLTEESPAESVFFHPIGDHGVFIISAAEPRAFSETDRHLVEILANHLEAALDRVEREQTLRTRQRRLEALHEATRDLIRSDSESEIAERVTGAAEEILEFSIAAVRLYEPDAGGLVPVATTSAVSAALPDREVFTPEGDSLNWDAFDAGEVRVYDDIEAVDGASDQGTGLRSLMVLPMGEFGTLALGETTPAAFDDTDEFLGRILATAAETALQEQQRETQLRRRRDELERQNDRLDEFASVISHDLRNPLNVANLRLDLASEDCDSDHLAAIDDALDRMEDLIENLLVLARQGTAVEEPEPVDLSTAVEQCWGTVDTADATLRTETDRVVRADESQLRRLLENLVRNAVEHGSTGSDSQAHQDAGSANASEDAVEHGSTSGQLEADDAGTTVTAGGAVTVTVGELDDGFYLADDGPGIPPEERDAVFESGYSTAEDATGLGLRIVERIADAHGWEVAVTDSEDGGARFEITGVEFA